MYILYVYVCIRVYIYIRNAWALPLQRGWFPSLFSIYYAVFQWGHEEETEFPPSQTLVTWEDDEEEADIIPTPLNCTFN